ncbi:hypothetical protein [Agaribacter marinus]|uniref:Uncharacterized protein n=1 Tax=Agaribacter marinus TaxID=1431249 RepID=A0AA37SW66_9ALTE|nr:hypothetical protein [Agaribacter marinus]GLR70677.1 hypothetical protein GCM10007852_15850 [Agaribacter marinus]
MKFLILCALLLATSLSYASQTLTANMGSCYEHESQYSTGEVKESDRYTRNGFTVLSDVNSSLKFSCFVTMFADKFIEEIKLDFAMDSAAKAASVSLAQNDPNLLNYAPKCKLIVHYNPGGNDFIDLIPSKSVPWGHYNRLLVTNPSMQNNGNGKLSSGVLECNTGYYTDETRIYGLRIKYAD